MACFLVSAAEAAVVAAVEKAEEKKEAKGASGKNDRQIPLSRKLKWLTWLLCGGAFLLMFEHVWHGEVVPWFPFLTAMSDAGDAAEMLREMATVGVTMAVLITAIWIGICIVAEKIVQRPEVRTEA